MMVFIKLLPDVKHHLSFQAAYINIEPLSTPQC